MIITITPNPAIDIAYFIDDFQVDNIHKVSRIFKTAGGKGLNVSKVLKILGTDLVATGFIGGNAGNYIKDELNKRLINYDFTKTEGETRTAYTINDNKNATTTEIRESGPTISESENEEFFKFLASTNKENKIYTCSGSLPNGLDERFYVRLLETLKDNKLIIDTSGSNLRYIVFESEKKPYAIKPNIDEIKDLFGDQVDKMTNEELLSLDAFKEIPIVVVSLGKYGCIAKFGDKHYKCTVPVIEAINPVGSGDSSIAGLAYGIDNNLSNEEILKYSMACGVLNALEEEIGYININNLENIKSQIVVEEI